MNHRNYSKEKVQQVSRPSSFQKEYCEFKKKFSEEILLVKKSDFLAFICAVISKATEFPQGSDKVNSMVDIANYFLGFRSQASRIQELLNSKYDSQDIG